MANKRPPRKDSQSGRPAAPAPRSIGGPSRPGVGPRRSSSGPPRRDDGLPRSARGPARRTETPSRRADRPPRQETRPFRPAESTSRSAGAPPRRPTLILPPTTTPHPAERIQRKAWKKHSSSPNSNLAKPKPPLADATPLENPAEPHAIHTSTQDSVRLQKILSQAGIASRRKAEELILEGRVTVNGKVVTELGSKADLSRDHVKVDGRLLHAPKHFTYIALNKPKGCVTTVSDPQGRQTVMHLLRGVRERVFPVGRLDYQSEGLLLLTNDGEFAHRITAPSSHVLKTYVVKSNGVLTPEQEKQFAEGIPLSGRRTAPAEIKLIKTGVNPWYEVKIAEGRQNQIRVMFKHFGKLVEKLRRVRIAFFDLDVAPGRYRSLTSKEVERFRKLLKLA